MQEAHIWYTRDSNDGALLDGLENEVVLSEEFYREIMTHPIPADLEAAKVLSSSPAALDLFMWLSYYCFTARGEERIPLFGDFGMASQLGSAEYARPRKFRERLENWLDLVRTLWPHCPAKISSDGLHLLIEPAIAIKPSKHKSDKLKLRLLIDKSERRLIRLVTAASGTG